MVNSIYYVVDDIPSAMNGIKSWMAKDGVIVMTFESCKLFEALLGKQCSVSDLISEC